jgi:hypothetical protein
LEESIEPINPDISVAKMVTPISVGRIIAIDRGKQFPLIPGIVTAVHDAADNLISAVAFNSNSQHAAHGYTSIKHISSRTADEVVWKWPGE